jgi:hypothetical protein
MCLSCGCGQPNEDHGDARHITMEELEEAARAADISTQEAARNISQAVGAETTSENPPRRS